MKVIIEIKILNIEKLLNYQIHTYTGVTVNPITVAY